MFAPVPTPERHEMLISRPGLAVELTDSEAALLVAEPFELETVQVYDPAFAKPAPEITSVGDVAPTTEPPLDSGDPFSRHW